MNKISDNASPYDDLMVLRPDQPDGMPQSTNGYAILAYGRAIFVDTPFVNLLPQLNRIAEDYTPTALILSHRHVAAQADAMELFSRQWQVPVFLHPIDAHHPQARRTGHTFQDPTDSPILREFDLDALLFPGHTEGHLLMHWKQHGGVLLTGDCAMGTTFAQDAQGMERMIRPPFDFNVDDDGLRQLWLDFDTPVTGVAAYHGTIYLDRADDIGEIMAPLTRAQITRGFGD